MSSPLINAFMRFDARELGWAQLKGHLPVFSCSEASSCWGPCPRPLFLLNIFFLYSHDGCTFLHVTWHKLLWKCSYTVATAFAGGYSAPLMVELGWGALIVGPCFIESHWWCLLDRAMGGRWHTKMQQHRPTQWWCNIEITAAVTQQAAPWEDKETFL